MKKYMLLLPIITIFIPIMVRAQIEPNESYKSARKYIISSIDHYSIEFPGPGVDSVLSELNSSSADEETLFATLSFSDAGTTYNVEFYYRPLGSRIRTRVLAGDKELHGLFNRFYNVNPNRQINIFVVREDSHLLIYMNMGYGELSLEETSINTDLIYDAIETFIKSHPLVGSLHIFIDKPPGLLKKTCRASMGGSYLVNEDGQVDEFSLENLRVAYFREGITAQNQEDFERIAISLIKAEDAHTSHEIVLISDVNDIPRYSSHPMDPNSAKQIKKPWSYSENQTDYWICYTYKQLEGIVSRYEFGFQEGVLTSAKKLVLGNSIGAARFIPGIPSYRQEAVNRTRPNRRNNDSLFSAPIFRIVFIAAGVILLVLAYIVRILTGPGSAVAKHTGAVSPPPTEENRNES